MVIPALEVTKVSLFIVPPPYQSVAIYHLPLLQVVSPALEVTKVSLFIVSPPAKVVIPALEVTKVSLFIVFPPLPRW